MKIGLISGSHRKVSLSRQTLDWVSETSLSFGLEPEIFDLSQLDIPFWSENQWNGESEDTAAWLPISRRLQECDGFVVVSPEWAGMIPPRLTNFFLHCSRQELSYKPTLLIGVSAGPSGTYPIAQMRMSAGKNNQMIFLPDHLILRQGGTFINPKDEEILGSRKDLESHLNKRLRFNLKILSRMSEDLKRMRESIETKGYSYGL